MDFKTIFSEGKKEWRRRRTISQDNSVLKSKQSALSSQMTALGQRAWGERIDISSFPDIKSILETNQARLEELKEKTNDGLKRKEEKETQKNQDNERFNKERQVLEEKKKALDVHLNTEKDQLKILEKNLSQAENRSGQISREREQLQQKIADANTSPDQRIVHEKKLEELASEETELLGSRRNHSESIKLQTDKIEPLQVEVNDLSKQISSSQSLQKETVAVIDKELGEIRKELDTHQTQAKTIEKEQTEQFRLLGEGLAAKNDPSPCLGAELGAIRETEQEIEGIESKITELDSQQNEDSSSAYKKMLGIIIGGSLLLIALIVLAVILLSPKKRSPIEELARGNAPLAALGEIISKTQTNTRDKTRSEEPGDFKGNMESVQQGLGAIKKASEEKIGEGTPVASEKELAVVLTPIPGWESTPHDYSSMSFSDIETASLRTSYQNGDGETVQVEITDTHSVAVLLAPSQALFMMNMAVDDDQIYQKTGKHGDIPMIESLEKKSGTARLALVIKDRFLVNLETDAADGLDLLKTVLGRLDLKALK